MIATTIFDLNSEIQTLLLIILIVIIVFGIVFINAISHLKADIRELLEILKERILISSGTVDEEYEWPDGLSRRPGEPPGGHIPGEIIRDAKQYDAKMKASKL